MKKLLMSSVLLFALGACGGGGSSPVLNSPSGGTGSGSGTSSGGSGGGSDLFVNQLVSKPNSSSFSNGPVTGWASISGDGNIITFTSEANNLVDDDSVAVSDVFISNNNSLLKVNYRQSGNPTYDDSYGATIDRYGENLYFLTRDPNVLGASQGPGLRAYNTKVSNPKENITLAFEGSYSTICTSSFNDDNEMIYTQGGDVKKIVDGNITVFNLGAGVFSCPQTSNNGFISVRESFGGNIGIFRYNLNTGEKVRVDVEDSSWNNDGIPDINPEAVSDISSNGRYVTFSSEDNRLTEDWGNDYKNIYIRDLTLNTTTLISKGIDGGFGNQDSINPSMSDDGKLIVFETRASNLTEDGGGIILYNVETQVSRLLSKNISGGAALGKNPKISDDGSTVIYLSSANNIVSGDMNGVTDLFMVKVR